VDISITVKDNFDGKILFSKRDLPLNYFMSDPVSIIEEIKTDILVQKLSILSELTEFIDTEKISDTEYVLIFNKDDTYHKIGINRVCSTWVVGQNYVGDFISAIGGESHFNILLLKI
jgi:hypothetical protein